AAHKGRFGFIDAAKALVVEAVSVEAVAREHGIAEPELELTPATPEPAASTRFFSRGVWHDAAIHHRQAML
ncbi:hypothetical protein, partial [Klebsiella michiganensis]|uniref:hypothetical protein n=1 Tax=Klebsiella michiganensis TaxID=1134687 RepID=UPI0013D668DE